MHPSFQHYLMWAGFVTGILACGGESSQANTMTFHTRWFGLSVRQHTAQAKAPLQVQPCQNWKQLGRRSRWHGGTIVGVVGLGGVLDALLWLLWCAPLPNDPRSRWPFALENQHAAIVNMRIAGSLFEMRKRGASGSCGGLCE
jgi:hypothetical protein